MELLYYWIDEDKTFKDQGFHFSNRFLFKVEPKKGEFNISIEENPEFNKDFYGNHISNLTAIIGENGAGKTNLLFDLISRLSGYQYVYGYGYFIAFFNGSSIELYETITYNLEVKEIHIASKIKTEIKTRNENTRGLRGDNFQPKLPERTGLIYFNPIYDLRDYPFQIENREFADVSSTFLLWSDSQHINKAYDDMVSIHRSEEIKRQYGITYFPALQGIDIISEIRVPQEIVVSIIRTDDVEKTDLGSFSRILYKVLRTYGSKIGQEHNHVIYDLTKKGTIDHQIAKKEKAKNWLLINFIDHFFYCLAGEKDLQDKIFEIHIEDFPFFNENNWDHNKNESEWPTMTIETFRSIIFTFFEKQKYISQSKFDISFQVKKIFDLIDSVAKVTEENAAEFIFNYDSAFLFAKFCDEYVSAFENEYRKSLIRMQWRNISSGELGFLNIFSRIFLGHSQLLPINQDPDDIPPNFIYLLIDEGEHGMHPHWQKKFIKIITDFLKFFEGIKFQVILTSHSPIILSDILKENVVFLEKSKELTRVVSNDMFHETFASNIHTLFKESFFLKGGLMGEFAKEKIQSIISNIEQLSKSTDQNTASKLLEEIRIIGEPILRNSLRNKIIQSISGENQEEFLRSELRKLEERKKKND